MINRKCQPAYLIALIEGFQGRKTLAENKESPKLGKREEDSLFTQARKNMARNYSAQWYAISGKPSLHNFL